MPDQLRLQILGGTSAAGARGFAGRGRRPADPRTHDFKRRPFFFRRSILKDHLPEFGVPVQAHVKENIDQFMVTVHLNFGFDLRFEISVLLKEFSQGGLRIFHIHRGKRAPRGVVGYLQLEIRPQANGVRVLLICQPAFYFGIFDFPGASGRFAYSRLLQVADYPPRGAFSPVDVKDAQTSLTKFFQQNGYFEAEVKPEVQVDSDHELVNVLFT